MNPEYNLMENLKRAEEMKKKQEDELFLKYCPDPQPEWLNAAELTEEQKKAYDKVRKLNREKFIAKVINGKLKLNDEEKDIFDGRQEKENKKEGVNQEKIKNESWYEKLAKEKAPTAVFTKIPGAKEGSEYKGVKESEKNGKLSGGGREEWRLWSFNDSSYSAEKNSYPKLLREAKKDTLVVVKKKSELIIEFFKVLGLDKRYVDDRDFHGLIIYQPSKKMLEEIWDGLRKNPSDAYKLIDPELIKLVSLPPDLKIVLEEKE